MPQNSQYDAETIPQRTTPTWEMEVLLSGATVFALFQLYSEINDRELCGQLRWPERAAVAAAGRRGHPGLQAIELRRRSQRKLKKHREGAWRIPFWT